MLNGALVFAQRAARVAVWAGGGLIIASACLVTVDVLGRKLFNFSFAGADEISGYVFAIATAFALPFCLLSRANVRIDAAYNLLPRGARAWLDLLGLVLLAAFAAMVTWRASLFAWDSWTFGSRSITPLQTPLVVPQGLWVAGLVLFLLVLVLLIVATAVALLRGDRERVQQLAGVRTHDEEIRDEIGR